MTTSTVIILNGIIAAGLLGVVALAMYMGHRVAGSKATRVAHWSGPLELARVRTTDSSSEFERAA